MPGIAEDINLVDSNIKLTSDDTAEVKQPVYFEAYWQTPGKYLAGEIASHPLVRFIGERIQTDYLQTVIVIDDNPEVLLDKIFSLEQKLYTKFKGLRFDVRVRTIPPSEDIETIKNPTLFYYDRDNQYK